MPFDNAMERIARLSGSIGRMGGLRVDWEPVRPLNQINVSDLRASWKKLCSLYARARKFEVESYRIRERSRAAHNEWFTHRLKMAITDAFYSEFEMFRSKADGLLDRAAELRARARKQWAMAVIRVHGECCTIKWFLRTNRFYCKVGIDRVFGPVRSTTPD
jgi:hypothetical protein